MPFELKNVSTAFMDLMNKIFYAYLDQFDFFFFFFFICRWHKNQNENLCHYHLKEKLLETSKSIISNMIAMTKWSGIMQDCG